MNGERQGFAKPQSQPPQVCTATRKCRCDRLANCDRSAADALRQRERVQQDDGAGAEQAPGCPVGRDDVAGGGAGLAGCGFDDRLLEGEGFDAQQAAISADRQEE